MADRPKQPELMAGVLSNVQLKVLAGFSGMTTGYLTGGAALGGFYLGHRGSVDLDFFGPHPAFIREATGRLKAHCSTEGLLVQAVREHPGFARFRVTGGPEETLVDFAHDPVGQTVAISDKPSFNEVPVDALEDIAANKWTALLGRGELKDLVDLFFLEEDGYHPIRFLEAAAARDGGVDPATLAWVLGQLKFGQLPNLLMRRPVSVEALTDFRDELVERLQRLAWPGHV